MQTIISPSVVEIIQQPTNYIVDITIVKKFLRIKNDTDNEIIELLIKSGSDYAEQYTGISVDTKKLQLIYNNIYNHSCKLYIPYTPILNIESINLSNNEESTELTNSSYQIHKESNSIFLEEITSQSSAITIVYTAGYSDAENIPKLLIQGIIQYVSAMYNKRGTSSSELNRINKIFFDPFKKRTLRP